jgi:hypothetical protein
MGDQLWQTGHAASVATDGSSRLRYGRHCHGARRCCNRVRHEPQFDQPHERSLIRSEASGNERSGRRSRRRQCSRWQQRAGTGTVGARCVPTRPKERGVTYRDPNDPPYRDPDPLPRQAPGTNPPRYQARRNGWSKTSSRRSTRVPAVEIRGYCQSKRQRRGMILPTVCPRCSTTRMTEVVSIALHEQGYLRMSWVGVDISPACLCTLARHILMGQVNATARTVGRARRPRPTP